LSLRGALYVDGFNLYHALDELNQPHLKMSRDRQRESNMTTGPQGQKRPADVIGNAVHVMQIATGEIRDTTKAKTGKTRSGIAGAAARAKSLSPEARTEIAKKAAAARGE
jgi:hypothetical protein